MPDDGMVFAEFVQLVLDALDAADVKYLIGGAVAVWAWGEPRTTRDLDLVIELPFESMLALSQELEKRDMLVPVETMVDLMIEARADLPISAIHMFSVIVAKGNEEGTTKEGSFLGIGGQRLSAAEKDFIDQFAQALGV